MQKQMTMFKSTIQGFESLFYFDSNSSVDIAKMALCECLKWVGQIEDASKQAQVATESNVEDKPPEQSE